MIRLITIFFSIFTFVGCTVCGKLPDRDQSRSSILNQVAMISDLWIVDEATDSNSEHVWIILQGGPREFMYFERDGRTLARYLPEYSQKHVVYLHQSQTLNPALFSEGEAFTMADARVQKQLTTEALHLAVKHFKKDGRTVTVIGHSYGAFIIQDYLANHPSAADHYIVSAGRLSVPNAMTEDNIAGMSSNFLGDGLTYNDISSVDLSDRTERDIAAYIVRARLKAAYGETDYQAELENRDLSNVTYISGRSDQQVGRLTDPEIEFLQTLGAQVLIVDGGHSDVYKRMIDRVTDRTIKVG